MIQRLNRNANRTNKTDCALPDAKPERDETPALGGTVQGKAEGVHRATVRFTGYRVRPLDPDNFAGSIKDLLDGLRHANLISGDEAWRIKLETQQVRVSHRHEEATVIEIFPDYENTPNNSGNVVRCGNAPAVSN